jgi:4-amino-4-deoxy-L-arabinose transferase-like glycosyltransferase
MSSASQTSLADPRRLLVVAALVVAGASSYALQVGDKNKGVEIAILAALCLCGAGFLGVIPEVGRLPRAGDATISELSASARLIVIAMLLTGIAGYLAATSVNGLLPIVPWLGGVVCAVVAFHNPRPLGFQRRHAVIAGILLAVALASRTIDLGTIPFGTHDDEAHWAQYAISIWQNKAPVFAYLWDGYPGSSFVPYSLTLGLLGENLESARLASALMSSIAIPLLYLLGTIAFDSMTGILSALLLLTNASNFHFSRSALPNIEAIPVVLAGGIALLAVTRHPDGRRSWALLGISAGVCLEAYLTSVVWPVVATIALIPFCVSCLRAGRTRTLLTGIGIAFFVCLLTASPMIVYSARHPGVFGSRGATITIWNMQERNRIAQGYGVAPDDLTGILRGQVERSFASIYSRHDSSLQYAGRETLDSVAGVAFILGWAALLLRWRSPGTWFTIVYFVGAITLGSILLLDPPFQPRMVALTPCLCLIAGLGVSTLCRALFAGFRRKERWALALAGVTVLISASLGLAYYFVDYRMSYPGAEKTAIAHYLSTVQGSGTVYLVGIDETTDSPTFQFAAPRATVAIWQLSAPPPVTPAQDIRAFVMPVDGPKAQPAQALVVRSYPAGKEYILTSAAGKPVAKVWDLRP